MSSLKVAPVCTSILRRTISKLLPPAHWFDLVDYKGERMLAIARLVVMNRAELSLAYSARSIHRLEPGPVFPAAVSVALPRVTFTPPHNHQTPWFILMPPVQQRTPLAGGVLLWKAFCICFHNQLIVV